MSGPVIAGVADSPEARDVLALGGQLAKPFEAELVAAHVSTWGPIVDLHLKRAPEDARKLFTEALEDLAGPEREAVGRLVAEGGSGAVARFVSAGSAAAGLHALAEELRARMIVLGRSHRSGAGAVVPGRTAQQLLSGAPVPVAIAPRGHVDADAAPERIGCAVDVGAIALDAIGWAADLALRLGVSLELISVHRTSAFDDLPLGRREELHAYHREAVDDAVAALSGRVDATGTVLDGDPAAELGEYSAQLDLLVLGSRGYGPLRAVLLGSDSTEIVKAARCPVAVVPRGSEVPARTSVTQRR